MLALVIKKEILEHLMSLRFSLACILCFITLGLGAWVNSREYTENLADFRANVTMHRLEAESYNRAWMIIWQGAKVDLPLNIMQIFASRRAYDGVRTIQISQDFEPQPASGTATNPLAKMFPRTDLIFFVGIVMSLLALVFSYDAVSGEKEQGTLRLMLSYSIPRDTYLMGKWIGGFISLVLPLALGLICAVMITLVFRDVHYTPANWLQLALLFLFSVLYLAAIYSLGLFVSARTERPATAAVAVLLAWVILVLAWPAVTPYLAARFGKASSLVDLEKKKRDVIKGGWEQCEAAAKAYDQAHDIPEKWWESGLAWDSEKILKRRIDLNAVELKTVKFISQEQEKMNNDFLNGLTHQTMLGQHMSRLSPFSSFMYVMLAAAGEDAGDERAVRKQLVEYKDQLADYGFKKQREINEQRLKGDKNPPYSCADYPRFQMPVLSLSHSMGAVALDVALLLIWNAVFFMGAYMSFLRYDVR
jgi:ABC-type transport system involved in multi-copper enzyme maturation permease subunit